MKKLLTAVLVLSIALFSCQKEVDDIFANSGNTGGNNNADTLLTRLTSKSGSDSTALNFSYNAAGKMTGFTSDIIAGGFTVSVSQRAERNAQGIIQRVIHKAEEYQQLGLDSVTTVVKYSGGKYVSEVTVFDIGGIVIVDSIALFHDGAGKTIKEEQYLTLMGMAELTGKTEYTYTGNNLASIKNFSWDGTAYSLDETITYDQYDTKVNPMYTGNDAFVFGSPGFYSVNNPVKSTESDSTATFDYTIIYNYNTSNRPVAATSVIQPGNITSTGNYYYQ